MSGHSKWANIKHRKAAQDNRRAKVWTRVIKEITIAARDGGGDPDTNPSLRLAIQNGKGANLPKDTIDRAIKKGVGGEGANLEPHVYEGYGPHGIAMVIETMTDNVNRTVANIRTIFNKCGGSLGTNGSLSFIFDQKGIFVINSDNIHNLSEEEFEMAVIDGGAEEIELNDDKWVIYTTFEDFGSMQRKVEELEIEVESASIQRLPNSTLELKVEEAQKVLTAISRFEEDDDVNEIYHNLELTDELQEVLNAE